MSFNFTLPDPVIHATAESRASVETIDKRLKYLRSIAAAEDVNKEIQYLEKVRERKCQSKVPS